MWVFVFFYFNWFLNWLWKGVFLLFVFFLVYNIKLKIFDCNCFFSKVFGCFESFLLLIFEYDC